MKYVSGRTEPGQKSTIERQVRKSEQTRVKVEEKRSTTSCAAIANRSCTSGKPNSMSNRNWPSSRRSCGVRNMEVSRHLCSGARARNCLAAMWRYRSSPGQFVRAPGGIVTAVSAPVRLAAERSIRHHMGPAARFARLRQFCVWQRACSLPDQSLRRG
jgi:hypothetical protein